MFSVSVLLAAVTVNLNWPSRVLVGLPIPEVDKPVSKSHMAARLSVGVAKAVTMATVDDAPRLLPNVLPQPPCPA